MLGVNYALEYLGGTLGSDEETLMEAKKGRTVNDAPRPEEGIQGDRLVELETARSIRTSINSSELRIDKDLEKEEGD